MRKRSVLVWIVTIVTLGSGLLNLFSVIGPALPQRAALLREVFPLAFLHLSRFLTLLIGFALIISSINIYKRKKRAFQIVFLLACLSVFFHLAKGLDYGAALFSLALLGLLSWARGSFTVKSDLPELRLEVVRFLIAMTLALSYGVAGFWLLDQREFGINFTLGDAIHRTWLLLSLRGDPQIAPHTRYAHWFLDSLNLITVTAIGYSVFALFRPVIYQFRTRPHERALAAGVAAKHGRSALDYFKLWPDKSYFFSHTKGCFLAYRVARNFAMVLSDPVGPEEEIEETIGRFSDFCAENDWGLGFYQTLPDFLPIYRRVGFKELKIGDAAIVDLTEFTLAGKRMKKLRNKLKQLEKSGMRIIRYGPPLPERVLWQAQEVSDEWLRLPGRQERGFSLGRFEPNYIRATPLFTVTDKDGRMLAFANIIPSYRQGEATIDLMRHRADAPNGTMDYLFVQLFLYNREQGFTRFSLGLAPMAGFQEKEEASPAEKAVHFFFQHLNFLFSFIGIRHYKAKFASSWEPRYMIYRRVLDLPKLAIALRQVSEIDE
jgi:phosphatidylglycerol lysyltransferase